MILTIANVKGGVAKSTTAVCLAAMAARDGVSVVIVDADAKGSATEWGNLREEAGIEPAIAVVGVTRKVETTVAGLATQYELVIVDIGAGNEKVIATCAELSDLVLLPCGPQRLEMSRTYQTLRLIGEVDVPAYVLLNRVALHPRAKETLYVRQEFNEHGVKVFDAVLPRRKVWEATGNGYAIHELDDAERATEEMRAVYDEIVRRANQTEVS